MIGFVFLFCLFFEWGILYQVLLVVGWFESYIQVVSFVWVFTIWYSLGLVLWQSRALELVLPLQRLRVWSLVRIEDSTTGFVLALSEIKTQTQNQETKDEPHTKGRYKIRQILIKIMEYTCTHSQAKSKQSNKNKVQSTDLANKGNQKFYLPVKNKTN